MQVYRCVGVFFINGVMEVSMFKGRSMVALTWLMLIDESHAYFG